METIKPFDIQNYFEDLGDGWRVNKLTGSIFFKNKELITTRASFRKVLVGFLKKKQGFKICEFLRKNFLLKDGTHRTKRHVSAFAKWIFLSINRIINGFGFEIKVNGGVCSQKSEWSLCYVD